MFEIFTWDVGGISQDLFMTNEYEFLWERHDACGAGSAPLKPSYICWGPTPTLLMEPPPIFKLKDRRVCQALSASSAIHPEFLRAGAGLGVGSARCQVEFIFLWELGWVRKLAWISSITCLAVRTCPPPVSQRENIFSKIDSLGVISVQYDSIAILFFISIEG